MSDSQVRAPPFLSCLAQLATIKMHFFLVASVWPAWIAKMMDLWMKRDWEHSTGNGRNHEIGHYKLVVGWNTRTASFRDNISMYFVVLGQQSSDAEARWAALGNSHLRTVFLRDCDVWKFYIFAGRIWFHGADRIECTQRQSLGSNSVLYPSLSWRAFVMPDWFPVGYPAPRTLHWNFCFLRAKVNFSRKPQLDLWVKLISLDFSSETAACFNISTCGNGANY